MQVLDSNMYSFYNIKFTIFLFINVMNIRYRKLGNIEEYKAGEKMP